MAGCSQADSSDKLETADKPSASSAVSKPTSTLETAKPDPVTDVTTPVRSADSHVHGGATLSIVSENEVIQIELETPLYNLLGFEYEPKSDAERSLVSNAEAGLSEPQNLFRLNESAACAFDTPVSKISLFGTHSDDDHHHEEKYNHDHSDHDENEEDVRGHDHQEHHQDLEGEYDHDHSNHHDTEAEADSHDHDKHHEHEGSESHKDVTLTYSLTCRNIEKLETVKVELFEVFPNLTELELVYLGPSQQMSANLTPSKTTADLTR